MDITQILKKVNDIYYLSQDLKELESGLDFLENSLKGRTLLDNNILMYKGLKYRITIKILLIKYYKNGYLIEDYNGLHFYLETKIQELENDSNFIKTLELFKTLLSITEETNKITFDCYDLLNSVNLDKPLLKTDETKVKYLINIFKEKLVMANENIINLDNLFNNVKIFNLKNEVISDLENSLNLLNNSINTLNLSSLEEFIKQNFSKIDENNKYNYLEEHDNLPNKKLSLCNTMVVLSPIEEEIIFYTRCLEKLYTINFNKVEISCFMNKENDFIEKVFNELNGKSLSLLFFGLNSYIDDNKNFLIESIIKYSLKNNYCLIADFSGSDNLYKEFISVIDCCHELSAINVSYQYLRMPTFSNVKKVFKEKNMIGSDEFDYIQKNYLYMGYVGFNLAIDNFIKGKDYKQIVLEKSLKNSSLVYNYLQKIPTQEQFLSKDWVNLNLEVHNETELTFNYDTLKVVNPINVKKIINSNLSLFAKCGLIARYCTLCGDDYSAWKTLDINERNSRLNEATKLVAFILKCEFEPQVEIVENDKWESKNSGGMCCAGGKLIKYKESSTLNYDWTIEAICHECYHAFQHTAINKGYKPWYFSMLCVSSSRLEEWNENFKNYVDIDGNMEGYLRQIVEADARIFEKDCFEQSDNNWDLIDFE